MTIDPQNFKDPVAVLEHAIAWLEHSRGEAAARQSLAFEILDQRRQTLVNMCVDKMISDAARRKGLTCPCSRHLEYWQTDGWRYYPPIDRLTQSGPEEPLSSRTGRPRVNGKAAAAGDKEDL